MGGIDGGWKELGAAGVTRIGGQRIPTPGRRQRGGIGVRTGEGASPLLVRGDGGAEYDHPAALDGGRIGLSPRIMEAGILFGRRGDLDGIGVGSPSTTSGRVLRCGSTSGGGVASRRASLP